jgi:hypothetical protein
MTNHHHDHDKKLATQNYNKNGASDNDAAIRVFCSSEKWQQ